MLNGKINWAKEDMPRKDS